MPYANNRGIRIYYEVEGQSPALLLLHGAPASTAAWREYGYVVFLKNDYKIPSLSDHP
jgi:pimeloyl-ACP methyl ester carboxylesterase